MVMVGSGRKIAEVSVIWWLCTCCPSEQQRPATPTLVLHCTVETAEVTCLPETSLLVLGRTGLHRRISAPRKEGNGDGGSGGAVYI
jgi:hypothetical protein